MMALAIPLLPVLQAAATMPHAGQPLSEALRLLQAQGLPVIFSTELVRPEMRVENAPRAPRPEDALAEILRPHRLAVRPGPGGRLLVVPASPAPAEAGPPAGPPPTFASDVRVVRVDVSVVGRDGRFVRDLTGADLEILEDGRPQATAVFLRRDVPLSLVLLLDASDSLSHRISLARAAAQGFLGGLRGHDEASVVGFNDATTVLQDMTSDAAALRRAVERLATGGSTALYNALYTTLRRLPEPGGDEARRRRAIVLVSDGEDTASLVWEEQVLELARRRGATIHVIDLGGRGPDSRSGRLLQRLARENGGELHRPASIGDLAEVYARVGEDLRNQYTLGYDSAAAPDGRWRRIEVRVRERGDLAVRHRLGYYAER